ncbi:Arabinose 5-phosphate isomerase KdsD [Aquimixticola soesokkakensis]|uniref:Arabinose 5-phosphate isomerase KdsD n=1 Tax=Aquimixticola soesokkakensis TaxID=1519096 RepID=A0A1Y5S5D4_9RHOB|nr:KpsF/GutQ family sugar-phosphate isomerase [Aquimixticola soesokkakensis]SLN32960.1 Arabinose 5-phosphate isomerase KdsD [Aquimixticola soesokkakensis]
MTRNDQSNLPPATVEALRVVQEELEALELLKDHFDTDFPVVVDQILGLKGRVIVAGMGKSGHIGRKIAATFASTGTPASFVHPAEASHGDMGMITPDDLCLLISNSGESAELGDMIAYTRRYGVPMVAITKNEHSTLGRQADHVLRLPDAPEACSLGRAPTTSTTLTLVLGDALAVAVMKLRKFDERSFFKYHPGGSLGVQLMPVDTLMHRGAALPVVREGDNMGEVLVEMTAKGLGIALVVDGDHHLTGIVTDGDLRRNLSGLMDKTAGDIASTSPRTIAPDALIEEAVAQMNARKVSVLPVVDAAGVLAGAIHIHDCLRAGVR